MKAKNIFLFILFPTLVNLLFISLYYSGIKPAQQLIAPTINWLSSDSWRELGMLEQLQNIYLLTILFMFGLAFIKRKVIAEKIFFLVANFFILFLFLEEIDYGLHFYELIIGEYSGIEERNWHNQKTGTKQNVRYLKKMADIMMLIWFVIIPLCKPKIKNRFLLNIIPSRWFIGTFITAIVMSDFAHFLEDKNFGIIDGIQGNLAGNVSEFREASNYYLYLLYTLQLIKTPFIKTSITQLGTEKRIF